MCVRGQGFSQTVGFNYTAPVEVLFEDREVGGAAITSEMCEVRRVWCDYRLSGFRLLLYLGNFAGLLLSC